jgi:WD40 repeat protein
MHNYKLFLCVIFLVCCGGCVPAAPPPVDTVEPTATVINTVEPETLTPTTAIVPATSTATLSPTFTITSTQRITETPHPRQGKYDFTKYGPLAYIDATLELMTIRMITPDGSRVDWIFEPERYYDLNAIAWSPDGTQLVLATTLDGINILSIADKRLINLSSTNEFSITLSPSFSPNGGFITFFSNNEGAIFRINADGAGLVNLTPEAHYRNIFYSPAWSPSGEQIVYTLHADGLIYSMNADGSTPRELIGIGWNEQARYSPDGRWLAFIRYNDDFQGFLYAMPIAGGTNRSLSSNQHDVESYSWSPDGRYLVFKDKSKHWMVEFSTGKTWEIKIAHLAQGWIRGGLTWSPLMKTGDARQDCTDGWTRLAIGDLVQLMGEVPSRVRSAPQKGENVVGEFISDEIYILLDGPVCADGLVWWEIADPRLPDGSGWTAEGDGQEYWLEPVNP